MVIKRPHIVSYITLAQPAYKDSNNNWVQGTAGESIEIPCSYQSNMFAKTIQGTDGQIVNYKGFLYIDKSFPLIGTGTRIIVREGDAVLVDAHVVQALPGHLKSHKIFV